MKHILKSLILFIIFPGCSMSNNVISQTDITASNSGDDSKQPVVPEEVVTETATPETVVV